MQRVHFDAGKGYDVWIGDGLLDRMGECLLHCLPACKAAIITDEVVAARYGAQARESLRRAGFSVHLWAFPSGEAHKNMETLTQALLWLSEIQLSRSDVIVALGGGVVGDLAGLAAALFCRGVSFIQVPTTLLAAVDASVGGKTAVDLPCGKNMAGTFHQPALVLCDTCVMRELPQNLLRDGSAEMLKYGMLRDKALFDAMASGAWKMELEGSIARCIAIKRDYVRQDVLDEGKRRFLNLGHTFGHAVEKCSEYRLSHGQCVGIGLCMASRAAGIEVRWVEQGVAACGLPAAADISASMLANAALSDKKRQGGKITLVLPVGKGRCALKTVPVAELPLYFARAMRNER